MTDEELIEQIEAQRGLMISVSTGGPSIQSVNEEYRQRKEQIRADLSRRGIDDPNPYYDVWRWYAKWSSGDLPSYQSRRIFISDIYDPLIDRLQKRQVSVGSGLFEEPTGWVRVDRQIGGVREALEKARAEEEYQTVGLLCRESLVSLAQAVYDAERHKTLDGVAPSPTDAKRMLEAYISTEMPGSSNEASRRHAKGALVLASELVHRRTAVFRDAAMCAEATSAVVNLVAIVCGRRDPTEPS